MSNSMCGRIVHDRNFSSDVKDSNLDENDSDLCSCSPSKTLKSSNLGDDYEDKYLLQRRMERRIVRVLDVSESHIGAKLKQAAPSAHSSSTLKFEKLQESLVQKFIHFTERLHPWTTIKVSKIQKPTF